MCYLIKTGIWWNMKQVSVQSLPSRNMWVHELGRTEQDFFHQECRYYYIANFMCFEIWGISLLLNFDNSKQNALFPPKSFVFSIQLTCWWNWRGRWTGCFKALFHVLCYSSFILCPQCDAFNDLKCYTVLLRVY